MDRDQLTALVHAHQAELYRYLRYLGTRSPTLAEDLVQDTFLAALSSPNPPPASQDRLRAAWLRGIARNLFLNQRRRSWRNPVRIDQASAEEAESVWQTEFLGAADGFQTLEALRGCLAQLEKASREALHLFYRDGKSREDMAELLGMTEDGIKSLLRRLRGQLGACIRRRLALDEMGMP